jgi:hemoglobin
MGRRYRAAVDDEQLLFERVGGEAFFVRLVDRFYDGVVEDPVLVPLYPPEDLDGARARLTGFLVQFWGGPDDYSRVRGHPRLRMRHAPFAIGETQRLAWLRHMDAAVSAAVAAGELDAADRDRMRAYFERAALHMVNQPG